MHGPAWLLVCTDIKADAAGGPTLGGDILDPGSTMGNTIGNTMGNTIGNPIGLPIGSSIQ